MMEAALGPDRRIALGYAPARVRPALSALWRLDAALAAVVTQGREPMIRQIKLAWWREALEALDHAPPPPQPLLETLASRVLPAISGTDLAQLEEGWALRVTGEPLTAAALASYGAARGGTLFALSQRLLGGGTDVKAAGAAWALTDLARRTSHEAERQAALAIARNLLGARRQPIPRPLGLLRTLAMRDAGWSGALEPEGSRRRVARMLGYALAGR